MLRVLWRALCREPLFRRGHRHRRAQGQRPVAAGAELGAVPALGKGPLHRFVAALFFRQSVLGIGLNTGRRRLRRWAKRSVPTTTRNGGYGSRAPSPILRFATSILRFYSGQLSFLVV